MIKKAAISLILLISLSSIAQKTSLLKPVDKIETTTAETLFTHLNSVTFVTGETLFYKIYCLNSNSLQSSKISKIAYIKLIDVEKNTIVEHKLFLKNGVASGEIFIPSNLKTGQYKFIVFTKWMLNNNEVTFYENEISIINPFQTLEIKQTYNSVKNEENQVVVENYETNKIVKIGLDKKIFSNRELVTININSDNKIELIGNYSISIRKIDSLTNQKSKKAIQFSKNQKKESIIQKSNLQLPEIRGEQISGKISTTNSTQSIENIPVAFSIYGNENQFKIVKTDKNGNFIFNLVQDYKNTNAYIQVIKSNRSEYKLELDKNINPDFSKLYFNTNLIFDSIQIKKILKKSIASQVQNAYYSIKQDSISKKNYNKPFYYDLAIEYNLDDYTRFPTLKETIVEIVKEMYYTKDKENYLVGLRDYVTERKLSESCLVLVDGLLIQDINELFDWDMKNVQKISIVPGGYYYGGMLFDGIINFTTIKYDFETKSNGDYLLKTKLTSPISNSYLKDNNLNQTIINKRIPDYRYQLLWQPDFKFNQNEANNISFYTSDIKGNFEIIIEGFSEKGIPISAIETFTVE